MNKNDLMMKGFLEGEKELEAFEKNQFKKIYDSVKRKVENLSCIAQLAYNNELKTEGKLDLKKMISLLKNIPHIYRWISKFI